MNPTTSNYDSPENPYPSKILGYALVRTCYACPEQYDVFLDDKLIGYLRLRHGFFRADYPVCGGKIVYSSHPKGDGIFDDDERITELYNAIKSIKEEHEKQ